MVVRTVPVPVIDKMLEHDIRAQALVWEERLLEHLDGGAQVFSNSLMSSADRDYLEHITISSDILRFRLYDRTGAVFWSSHTGESGLQLDPVIAQRVLQLGDAHYRHFAATGETGSDSIATHGLTSAGTRHEVAGIALPVVDKGQTLGVIEFFTDITDLRNTFIGRLRTALMVLSGLGLMVMLSVLAVITIANRKQVHVLKVRAQKEQELMENQMQLAREVKLLGELNEWLQSSRSMQELFDMVAQFMAHMLPESEGTVYVYSNSRDVLDGSGSWNGGKLKDHIRPDECWGLRRGRTYSFGDSEVDFVCAHAEPHDDSPYFCFPILAHGETVGLMHLKALEGADIDEFHASRKLAQMCAEQVSLAIANVRMRDQLHDQSVRDPLTGLYNRRHMTETLRKFIEAAKRGTGMPSVISIDVDHFKKFNDNHGHDAGDMVLRAVGSVLQQACDGDEIACRPGGEEFMILLPDLDADALNKRAEALRENIELISVSYGGKALPRITVSIGLAQYPAHGTMPQDLMRAADNALYEAKAKGRNTVVRASGLADTMPAPALPDLAAE
ncbi:diguanylate cyclase [Actibacterium atlanticum]|uniref:diguanylate cyclase n=1 Tax=Actibacterium atlanticum TaxID=1461693 RepID=A0A058ZH89_9RHOB|nr:diguanylate cyclase [Actibacterium atlanticum]